MRSNNSSSAATTARPVSAPQSFNILDRLAKKLLQWDFVSDWKSDSNDRTVEFAFRTLPDAFISSQQYIETWEPLMIREVQQNIIADVRSNWNANTKANTSLLSVDPKSEGDYLIRVDTRAQRPEDQYTEVTPSSMDVVMVSLCEESIKLKGDKRISQYSQGNDCSLSSVGNKDSSNISRSYLAIVTSTTIKNGNHCSEWLLLTRDWQQLCSAAKQLQRQQGQQGSNSETLSKLPFTVHYRILANIRSSWREYFALMEVQRLPLKSFIFGSEFAGKISSEKKQLEDATSSNYQNLPIWQRVPLTMLRQQSDDSDASTVAFAGRVNVRHSFDLTLEKELALHWKASKLFMAHLKKTFNPSQLCAMHNAITSRGISLIQGPPGTGKTKTIVGLLNGIHLHEHNLYYDELLRLFMDPQQKHLVLLHDLTTRHYIEVLSRAVGSKPRILVVAPSNVAVDHIMERVISGGFQDGHGNTYHPRILRLGSAHRRGKQHQHAQDIHPIESVTLDHLLQEEINPSFLAASERRQKFDEFTILLQQCLVEVRNYHALLINLKGNFEICQPLPEGWELRVNIEDGRPFWVDHRHRTTTAEPPVHLRDTATTFGYRRYDQLPDYSKYAHMFTQALTRLETLSIKKARLEAVMTSLAINQTKDKNVSHNYHGFSSSLSTETKEMLETSLISETQVMFTTLNMCGHFSLEASEFTVAVIDEAAQCVEPAILIPLRRGCKKCVLVGDQDQLPATIFATEVKKFGYARSLFQRLIEAGHPYVMLDTQYRMRPEISRFPSLMFYDGLLRDGSSVTSLESYCLPNIRRNCVSPQSTYFTVEERARYFPGSEVVSNSTTSPVVSSLNQTLTTSASPPVYSLLSMKAKGEPNSNNSNIIDGAEVVTTLPVVSSPQWFLEFIDRDYYPIFNTLMFFDLQYSSENAQSCRNNSMSRMNLDEAVFCIHLIETLILDMQLLRDSIAVRNGPFQTTEEENSLFLGSIGIITPYSEQLSELKYQVQQSPIIRKFRMSRNIELNTVDGFQGREKDIIIISTVRANDEGDIGFVSNKQRMNVAITRAKYALFVVGNAQTLSHHGLWYSYIHYCNALNAVVTVPERFFISQQNDSNNNNSNSSQEYNHEISERNHNHGNRGKKRRRQDNESNSSYSQYASHDVHERSQLVNFLHSHLSAFQREHGVNIPANYVLYRPAQSTKHSRYG